VRGAARGYRHVIFMTISTGIGSGMICDGKMLLGNVGLAAEAGHIIMLAGDKVSTLEKEAAGPAIARKARVRVEAGEKSVIYDLVDGDFNRIDGAVVGNAARQQDALALDVIRGAGRMIGLGMVSLLHLFNPEILVFGGGVSNNLWDILHPPMLEAIQTHCIDSAYWEDLRIERAGLGENVSVIGAASLVVTQGGIVDVAEVVAHLNAPSPL
jgi:glucokinase